jgi:hypothetical protein
MASKPPPLSNAEIDALYGLEPVLYAGETEAGAAPAAQDWLELSCPACGEQIGTAIDLSAGSLSYIEDCQVCCQPMVIHLECDAAGNLERGWAERGD